MSFSRIADGFTVYNRALCAWDILAARYIPYGICEIIWHKLNLLNVVGRRRILVGYYKALIAYIVLRQVFQKSEQPVSITVRAKANSFVFFIASFTPKCAKRFILIILYRTARFLSSPFWVILTADEKTSFRFAKSPLTVMPITAPAQLCF